MKFILAAVVAVMSVSAFAQKHMVQFGTDTQTLSSLSYSNEKYRGEASDETRSFSFETNYAYTLTSNLQVGGELAYEKEIEAVSGSSEGYRVLVSAAWNFNTDLRKALYVSAKAGYSWSHNTQPNEKSETFISGAAIGKRYPLSFIGLENVTYSPEVAFTLTNPTTKNDMEWSQDLSFKILQFSVFF